MSINLKKIIKEKASTVWVEYLHGISFQIQYLSKMRVVDMSQKSVAYKYSDDPAVKQRVGQTDPKLLAKNLAANAVLDWKGVTPLSLSNILDLDLSGLTDEQRNAPIPFDPEAMATILLEAFDLDVWLQTKCTDVSVFRQGSPDALPNSSTSPSGVGTP